MTNYRVSLIANSATRDRAWVGASKESPMAANLSEIVYDAITVQGCIVSHTACGGSDVSANFTAPDDAAAIDAFRAAVIPLASGARLFRMDPTPYGATGVAINHYGIPA